MIIRNFSPSSIQFDEIFLKKFEDKTTTRHGGANSGDQSFNRTFWRQLESLKYFNEKLEKKFEKSITPPPSIRNFKNNYKHSTTRPNLTTKIKEEYSYEDINYPEEELSKNFEYTYEEGEEEEEEVEEPDESSDYEYEYDSTPPTTLSAIFYNNSFNKPDAIVNKPEDYYEEEYKSKDPATSDNYYYDIEEAEQAPKPVDSILITNSSHLSSKHKLYLMVKQLKNDQIAIEPIKSISNATRKSFFFWENSGSRPAPPIALLYYISSVFFLFCYVLF